MQRIVALFQAGRLDEARAEDEAMREILYGIHGGKTISCWLTGLKYLMVKKGIFSTTENFLGYPLTDECREMIEGYAQRSANCSAGKLCTVHQTSHVPYGDELLSGLPQPNASTPIMACSMLVSDVRRFPARLFLGAWTPPTRKRLTERLPASSS